MLRPDASQQPCRVWSAEVGESVLASYFVVLGTSRGLVQLATGYEMVLVVSVLCTSNGPFRTRAFWEEHDTAGSHCVSHDNKSRLDSMH